MQDNLASELREWKFPGEQAIKNFNWRSHRAPSNDKRRRTNAGTSTPSGNSSRGDNGGPVDADGFDYDQFIMKWQHGVIEDGKEVRAISAEGDILSAAWLEFGGNDVASLS